MRDKRKRSMVRLRTRCPYPTWITLKLQFCKASLFFLSELDWWAAEDPMGETVPMGQPVLAPEIGEIKAK